MLSARFEVVSREFAERVAFFGPAGEEITYRNFFFTVVALAERLQDHGIEPGDRVAVEVRDVLMMTALKLALLRLGALALPKSPEGVADYRIDCRVSETEPTCLGEIPVIRIAQDWIRSPSRLIPVHVGGAVVTSTSGTTGLPKLRLTTEANLLARIELGLQFRGSPEGPALVGYGASSSPAFANIMRLLFSSAPVMLMRDTLENTLEEAALKGVKRALIPAGKLPGLIEAAEQIGPQDYALEVIQCGGGSISPSLALRAEARFGAIVINTFGSNETGSIAHFRPSLRPDDNGIVGEVYPHLAIQFRKPDGSVCPAAEGGELFVKLPDNLKARSFPHGKDLCDPEGWLSTGDVGRMVDGKLLKLEGRISDLINMGGNKLAPSLFETQLLTMNGLSHVAVFRIETVEGIDGIGVAVVADRGLEVSSIVTRLRQFAGDRPLIRVFKVDALPMTDAGKVDRKFLTAHYSLTHTPEPSKRTETI